MKIGIVSDIHEDAVNLEKALIALEKQNCDKVVCLGDIIGFSYPNFGFFDTRNAGRCIDLIKANCAVTVAGNHDLYTVRRIPMHNAGFNYPPYWFQLDYAERKKLAGGEVWLNEENEFDPLIKAGHRDFLKQLPEFMVFETDSVKIMLSHYQYPDPTGSSRRLFEKPGPVVDHLNFISDHDCSIGFSGHLHTEGAKVITTLYEHNFNFETIQLTKEPACITGPCIANGKYDNGYMIFNTVSFELNVIPLNSPKRTMQVVYV